jgi:hypothetical protein
MYKILSLLFLKSGVPTYFYLTPSELNDVFSPIKEYTFYYFLVGKIRSRPLGLTR